MARVTHVNVVAIYDAGRDGAQVYVAMEHVDGCTLRQWVDDRRPTWKEAVDLFVAAAHGLAAAHDAGVVHRDFKPENVIVTRAGVPKVADFGLARTDLHAIRNIDTNDLGATQSVIGVGTPSYMAPEQLRGGPATAASDQFAFCVSLFETLFGVRPFSGDTFDALRRSVEAGEIRRVPGASAVPLRIRRVLERGLAVDPDRRWPSSRVLGRELARARRPLWRSGWLLAPLAVAVAVVFSAARLLRHDLPPQCVESTAPLVSAWNDERRGTVVGAIENTKKPFSAEASAYALDRLDAFARSWTDIHREACEGVAIHKDRSMRTMERQLACLLRSKIGLEAVITELEEIDEKRVARVHSLVEQLPRLDGCADPSNPFDDEETLSAEADAIRELLAAVKAKTAAGQLEASLEAAQGGLAAAQALGDPRLLADAWLHLGGARLNANDFEGAEAAYLEGLDRCLQTGYYKASDGARSLSFLAQRGMRLDEAKAYAFFSLSLARRTGDARLVAHAESVMAGVLAQQGEVSKAISGYRAALEHAGDDDEASTTIFRENLANALHKRGDLESAEAEHRVALASLTRRLGEHHPSVATVQTNLASLLDQMARDVEAVTLLESALETRVRAIGEHSVDAAMTRRGLASTLNKLGQHGRARTLLENAVADLAASLGPTHWHTAIARLTLADTLDYLGRPGEAIDIYEAALPNLIEGVGAADPVVGQARSNHAILLEKGGDFAAAEAEYRLILREQAEVQEPNPLMLQHTHHNLGALLEDLRR